MSNSVDPDETAHYEPSHLDLCCLQKPIIITCGSEGVKKHAVKSSCLFAYKIIILSPKPMKERTMIRTIKH